MSHLKLESGCCSSIIYKKVVSIGQLASGVTVTHLLGHWSKEYNWTLHSLRLLSSPSVRHNKAVKGGKTNRCWEPGCLLHWFYTVQYELTVNHHSHRKLLQIGVRHHHTGEGPLVFQRGQGDEQVGLLVGADPSGVIVSGLNCGLVNADLFDQQIPRSAVIFLLQK